jgi:hypothetical protein
MDIEQQLRTIIATPGMEDELENWQRAQRVNGKYNDMFDGRVA